MKMINMIVNKIDSDVVCDALRKSGFIFTKIATTGGFLRSGNITLLLGTEDDRVEEVIAILRKNCEQRKVAMPIPVMGNGVNPMMYNASAEVMVGGATLFIGNVERFEKF